MKKQKDNKFSLKRGLTMLSAGILLAGLVWSTLYISLRRYTATVNLENYTSLGLNGKGVPTAVIDVDAILTDLHLPNPRRSQINLKDYPDVEALSRMQVFLSYTDTPSTMDLSVSCDSQTLKRFGIALETLAWTQEIKGVIALDSTQPEPLATPTTGGGEEVPVPASLFNVETGFLQELLDEDGNGLNLRPLYERAQAERDSVCQKLFGKNDYNVSKTQALFVTDTEEGAFSNLYRAAYSAVMTGEGVDTTARYFTVEIRNLSWTEEHQLAFASVSSASATSRKAAEGVADYAAARYTVTVLPGGGVSNAARIPFDQNGFVRYPFAPTSFRMASGLYWSPSFDRLTEDQIWQLTGVNGHSLTNLLRYARREISARYGSPFDADREPEFLKLYGEQHWYKADAGYTDERMTETEARNIRLLREIQSLIEN